MGNYYHASLGYQHQQKTNWDQSFPRTHVYLKTARRSMFPQYVPSVSLLRMKPQLLETLVQSNENCLIRQNEYQKRHLDSTDQYCISLSQSHSDTHHSCHFQYWLRKQSSDKRQTISRHQQPRSVKITNQKYIFSYLLSLPPSIAYDA